jgi:L-alanine-DL-glutamate epimerase-like enolase superfamily enzyme
VIAPIERVEVIPLALPHELADDLDGTVETVLVRLSDADGRSGIGEADAPPSVVKAFLEMPSAHLWSQSPAQLLLGADPVEVTALWERLYEATIYPGRRGLGIHALSALDIALHDLAGKQLGIPAYKLMGGARRQKLRPYCTILSHVPWKREG